MRARLVGDDVGLEARGEQAREDVGGVALQPDAERSPLGLRGPAAGDGVVERVGLLVQVAGLEPPPDPVRVDLDAERHATVHRHRQRLGAAHAAEPGGQRDRARERAAVAPPRDLREALVGALHDALGADVDPRPGGHLPVHRQAEVLEPAELVPVGPVRDEVGVGDQHPRRPLVGAEDADRLARLDEQRLVVRERAQRAHDRVERLPRARRAAGAAVDDEVLRALGDVRVEVVHEHAQRGLLRPAGAGQLRAARRAYLARGRHAMPPISVSTARTSAPVATSCSAAARSGASRRSGPGPPTRSRSSASAAPVAGPGFSGARRSSP